MTARRLPQGGEIDRSRPLSFTFDGRPVQGFHGDTLASALLASGERILGRSFKYRRPRGLWGAGTEEPNVYADVTDGSRFRPNLRVTLEPARDGLALRSANTSPSARADRTGFLDLFARFLPSAFYYKTFFRPNWHFYEPAIRRMAGLGRINTAAHPAPDGDQLNHHCDAVVVGAGPVGIVAALALARAGESVVLADDGSRIGGSLLFRAARIDGQAGADWLAGAEAELARLGVTVLPRTTAFGVYDHGVIALNQRRDDGPDRLWRVRPRRIVLAAGAIERPLPFDANDLPGVMSAQAALSYLRRQAVLPGQRIVIATNNSSTDEVAAAMAAAGAGVTVIDARKGQQVARALGRREVTGVVLEDGTRIGCDCVLVSGGFTATIHLHAQAKGRLHWDDRRLSFVPEAPLPGLVTVGAAAGHFSLAEAFAALPAALGLAGAPVAETAPYDVTPVWPRPEQKGRVWIDLQHDVTAKDVEC